MTSTRASLDICVLVPVDAITILLSVVDAGPFTPLWNPQVMRGSERVVLPVQPAISTVTIRQRIGQTNRALGDTNVLQTVVLSASFDLPDEGDRHALIAAIAGRTDVLVTDNLRDSLDEMLWSYAIGKCSLDDFSPDLLDPDSAAVVRALGNITEASRQPSCNAPAMLAPLTRRNVGNLVRIMQIQLWRLPRQFRVAILVTFVLVATVRRRRRRGYLAVQFSVLGWFFRWRWSFRAHEIPS